MVQKPLFCTTGQPNASHHGAIYVPVFQNLMNSTLKFSSTDPKTIFVDLRIGHMESLKAVFGPLLFTLLHLFGGSKDCLKCKHIFTLTLFPLHFILAEAST